MWPYDIELIKFFASEASQVPSAWEKLKSIRKIRFKNYYSYSWPNYSYSLQAKRVASLHIRFLLTGPLAAQIKIQLRKIRFPQKNKIIRFSQKTRKIRS